MESIKQSKPVFEWPEIENEELPPVQNFRASKDTISFTVNVRVTDTDAATAAKYGTFFIAPFPCTLVKWYERHAVAGTNGSAVTMDIKKLTNGTAKASGLTMVASTINLKATADTYQTGNPSTVVTNGSLNKSLTTGQAVALQTDGTLTDVNDVCVTLVFKTDISNLPI